jgi:MSHA biogenesis protein MshI
MLFGSWRRRHSGGWRAGFMRGESETALAIVRSTRGHRPLLRHCAVHPAIEIQAEHVLAPLSRARDLAGAAVSGILNSADYQLVMVEAPEVPAEELRAAVRWQLRDIVSFPVAEAVIDVFEIPEPARYVEARMVFAVAARAEAVSSIVELVKPRARGFDVIDIPELCLRNLSALLPQDERGVALLALGQGFAQLVITCQGVLYLARRIELAQRADVLSLETGTGAGTEALTIELQRSLDYYESHYDRAPISDIIIASGDERAERLLAPLTAATGRTVRTFDVHELFDVAADIEPDTHFLGLVALGAALRGERTGT